ncbi:hypothetical protein MTO96_002313 [Rhipicephalus appendiculatus]
MDAAHEDSKKKKKGTRRHGRPRKDKSGSSSRASSVSSTTSSAARTPVNQRAPSRSSITNSRRQHRDSVPDSELSNLTHEQQKSQTALETSDQSVPGAAGGETAPVRPANKMLWGSSLLNAFPIDKAGNAASYSVASPPATKELSAPWTAAPSVETVRPNATESLATDVASSSAGKDCDVDTAAQDVGGQRSQSPVAHSSTSSASSTGSAIVAVVKPAERTSDSSRSSRRSSSKVLALAGTPSRGSVLLTSRRTSRGPTPRHMLEATAAKPETTGREANEDGKPLENQADGQHDAPRVPDVADTMAASDRNPWVRAAVISAGLSLFCVALIMIVVQLRNRRPAGDVGDPMCETDDCVRHASILEEVASKDVDPVRRLQCVRVLGLVACQDSDPQRFVTAMDFAIYGWMQALNNTLHEGSGKIRVGPRASCCSFLNETGLIWPFGPAPKVDALALFVSLAFNYDASFWFSVAISDSPGSSGEWRVVLSPSFELPIFVVHHLNVIESAAYALTWTKMLQSLAGDAARDLDEAEINETRSVGAEILRQLYAASGDPAPESALFAIGKIEDYTPSIPSARWLTAFQQVLPLPPTMATEVFVTHVGYMRTINSLFAKLENEQLLRHLSWLFLKMYIAVAGPEFLVGVYGNAETSKVLRPLFCGFNVEQPYRLLVSVLSYVSSATSNDRPLIDASFDSLVVEATEKLMNCYWLDDVVFEPGFLDDLYGGFPANETWNFGSTWIAARKSVRGTKASKLYRSLSTNPIGATEPYMTYDAILNRVLMTMGAVARPLYYRNGTRGMLYGGIGFLMALQLVKSLDRNGLRWHPNGSAVSNFLTEESRKEYAARDTCLVRDANASVFPEIPAVEVAYAALQRALKEDGQRFRIAKDLTEERVFFMTLCFMTCPRRYTPSAYRVDCNKALRNFAEFATAYRCPLGSNMNPPKKCRFFDSASPNPGD